MFSVSLAVITVLYMYSVLISHLHFFNGSFLPLCLDSFLKIEVSCYPYGYSLVCYLLFFPFKMDHLLEKNCENTLNSHIPHV